MNKGGTSKTKKKSLKSEIKTLQKHKQRQRAIISCLPETWEVGSMYAPVYQKACPLDDSDSDSDGPPTKRSRNKNTTRSCDATCSKNDVALKRYDSIIIKQEPEIIKNPTTTKKTSEERKKPKKDVKFSVFKSAAAPPLQHKSLKEWFRQNNLTSDHMNPHSYDKKCITAELKDDVIKDISHTIDHAKKRKNSQQQPTSPSSQLAEERERSNLLFMIKNEDGDGQFDFTRISSNPLDYEIFRIMIEEEREREKSYLEQTRAHIHFDKVTPPSYKDIEECSKEYCTDFFREPRGIKYGERQCRLGKQCIMNAMAIPWPDTIQEISPDDAFVCREFLLPSQTEDYEKYGTLPEDQNLCLPDNRLHTMVMYFSHIKNNTEPMELLQDHFNLIDQPGEYSSACCIYPNPTESRWTGIVRPIVKFSYSQFIYGREKDKKIKRVIEQNVDFHEASVAGTCQ